MTRVASSAEGDRETTNRGKTARMARGRITEEGKKKKSFFHKKENKIKTINYVTDGIRRLVLYSKAS